MPLIKSEFSAIFPFTNKHFSTIYRTLFTKPKVTYERTRINSIDNDFLDLDFSKVNSKKIAILIHGLEGSSNSKYIVSTTSYLNSKGIDAVAINLRGCSGELNNFYKSYHTGETGDLDWILKHIIQFYSYEEISLIGFSLGGNVVLKYVGEQKNSINSLIKKVVAISPPCDLKGSSIKLAKKSNYVYMKRFLNTLLQKVAEKARLFPDEDLNIKQLLRAKNFKDFDSIYTAPAFGFDSVEDYWKKASSIPYLKDIKIPTYLVTAKNDPFLSSSCFPIDEAKNSDYLFLELTEIGGHIGFVKSFKKNDKFWLEKKITSFLLQKDFNIKKTS